MKEKNVKINKVTLLGIACQHCGTVTGDPKIMDRALFRSWTCPACGERNISYRDMEARERLITSEPEPGELEREAQTDAEGEANCRVSHEDPEALRREHEEFLRRSSL